MDVANTEAKEEAPPTIDAKKAQEIQKELLAKRNATGVNYWLDIAKHKNSYGQEIPNKVKLAYLLAEPVIVPYDDNKIGSYHLYYIITDQGLIALRFDYSRNVTDHETETTLRKELERCRYLEEVRINLQGIELVTTNELLNGETKQIIRVTVGNRLSGTTLINTATDSSERVIDNPISRFLPEAIKNSEALIKPRK